MLAVRVMWSKMPLGYFKHTTACTWKMEQMILQTLNKWSVIKLKQELRERDLLLQGDKGELVQRLCTIMMKEHKRKEFQDQCMTTDETGFLERLRNPAVLFPGDMGKIGFFSFSFIFHSLLHNIREVVQRDCEAINQENFLKLMEKTLRFIHAYQEYSEIWRVDSYGNGAVYLMSCCEPAKRGTAGGFTKAGWKKRDHHELLVAETRSSVQPTVVLYQYTLSCFGVETKDKTSVPIDETHTAALRIIVVVENLDSKLEKSETQGTKRVKTGKKEDLTNRPTTSPEIQGTTPIESVSPLSLDPSEEFEDFLISQGVIRASADTTSLILAPTACNSCNSRQLSLPPPPLQLPMALLPYIPTTIQLLGNNGALIEYQLVLPTGAGTSPVLSIEEGDI